MRWFLDATRVARLAADHDIGISTTYRYLHQGIDAPAVQAPDLRTALDHARQAGISHLSLDGVVIPTGRCKTPGPTKDAYSWWSGKIHARGGDIQVLTLPDGRPLWTSPVRPSRDHDITAARIHRLIEPLSTLARAGLPTLADLGYEGEPDAFVLPIKTPKNREPRTDRRPENRQQAPARHPRPGRTRPRPAHHAISSPASYHTGPLAHRPRHRRRTGPTQPRTRPPHPDISHSVTDDYWERFIEHPA